MQPYSDSRVLKGNEGVLRVLAGAIITLTNSLGALQELFSDNGVTSIGTQITTDANGNFTLYAADGAYMVTTTYNGVVMDTRPLLLEDDNASAHVTPFDFQAVGDGVTDDSAALLAATATGKVVDGLGLTYAVTGNLSPASNFAGLINATLKQLTPTGTNRRTLFISGCTGFYLHNVFVNRNGNLTGGDIGNDAGIWIASCSKFAVKDIGSTGGGAGNGVTFQSCFDFYDMGVVVHDERYTTGSVPADDVINGIWYNNSYNFISYNPYVYDCGCLISAVVSKRRARGIVFGGCYNFVQYAPRVVNVDQGHDITGTTGNHDFSIIGGRIKGCYSYSFKNANSAYRGTYDNCVGDGAAINFVTSGPTEVSNPLPRDITYKRCISIDADKNGGSASGISAAGFRIQSVATIDATYPRGIVYDNCQAIDTQGSPTMLVGFDNDVVTGTAQGDINRLINGCKASGFVTSATNGFTEDNCVTGIYRRDGTAVRDVLFETDAPANEKMWDTSLVAGDLSRRTRTDADGAGETFELIQRTGTVVDLIRWNATAMRRGGVSDANRLEEADNNGAITRQYDNNALQNIETWKNYGITASGQGLSWTITYGTGHASGATAFKLDFRTTDTWAAAGNRSSELRMSVALAGNMVDAFRINPKFVGYGALPMRYCLSQSAVASAVTGTTTKTALATIAIPAGAIGPNGSVHVTMLWSMTNNANNKTFNVELDGTIFYGITFANQSSLQAISIIRNRNSESSQVGFTNATTGLGAATLVTAAIDTSVAKNLTISGTLANSADTITLEGYTVEIAYGA